MKLRRFAITLMAWAMLGRPANSSPPSDADIERDLDHVVGGFLAGLGS